MRHQLLGILVGLTGTAILIFKGAELNPNQNYWYALLVILSSIGYAFNVNILKKYLSDLSALAVTAGNFVILIVPTFIVLWYSDFFHTFEITEVTRSSLIYITLLAVLGTAVLPKLYLTNWYKCLLLYFQLQLPYLIPIVAVFWGLYDGENLTIIQLSRGILILLGVYLTNRK